MGAKGYRLGLNAKTLGVTFLIALLVVGATAFTARAFERLHQMVEQLSQVEMESLMNSVRIVQQAESLIGLGLMLSTAETQNDRRRALVELNDRTTWVRQMTSDLPSNHIDPEMLNRVREVQNELDLNIRILNHLVSERINERLGARELEHLSDVSLKNRELAGEMSVLMGYVAARVRLQIISQSQEIQQQIREHQQNLIALAVFIVLFALIAGVYFDMTVVRRILRMQRAVERSPVNINDFERQGKDEIAKLSQTVVSFIERIQQQEEHMLNVNQELSFLAEHDSLTGLANRRHFYAAAKRLLRQNHLPVCVALCDIDHFKEVNDQRGHAVGDVALQSIANTLTKGLRETDVLARFGGEEFAAIFSVATLDDAFKVFEKIRLKIESTPIEIPGQPVIWLTCSFGITIVEEMPLPVETSDEKIQLLLDHALLAADEALYDAKSLGRNLVCTSLEPVSAVNIEEGGDDETV